MNHKYLSVLMGVTLLSTSHISYGGEKPQLEGIRHYDSVPTFVLPANAAFVESQSTQKFMQFKALDRTFELELELNDALSEGSIVWVGEERKTTTPVGIHYKGKLKGEENSWVRVTIRNGELEGMIRSKDEIYVIEPAKNYLESQVGMLVYRLSDSDTGLPPGSCALEDLNTSKQMGQYARSFDSIDFQSMLQELNVAAATVSKELELGIIIDHEFFQKHGDNSVNLVQTLINQIDGIYEEELGISIRVGKTAVFTTPNDPFTDTIGPQALLFELRDLVASGQNPVSGAGLTHLFTGKDLEGSVAGIAFVGTVCRGAPGVGLSSDFTNANRIMVLLTAHEMGHNFNAPHDNQETSVCASTPFGFIMNPFLSNDLDFEFSDCSLNQINPTVASASCLRPVVANPEFELDITDTVDPVLEGQDFTYTIAVINKGQTIESDLVITGTLTSGLTFRSGDPGEGECTTSNQGFACTMNVPPATNIAALITVTPTAAGTQTLSVDLVSTNGTIATASETTVVQAVPKLTDLAVSASTSAGAKVGNPLTYTLQVRNNSTVTANDVRLVNQLSVSVDLVSASATPGLCSTSAQTVTCDLGAIGAGSQSTITVETSPTAAIEITNHVEVSSREQDENTGNNSADTVTLVAQGDGDGGEDDGGNGALTGVWFLSFLMVFLLRFRRKR